MKWHGYTAEGIATSHRYEIQTASGLTWGCYSAKSTLPEARLEARAARRIGYRVRVVDRKTGDPVS